MVKSVLAADHKQHIDSNTATNEFIGGQDEVEDVVVDGETQLAADAVVQQLLDDAWA